MRVSELANELGKTSKEVLDIVDGGFKLDIEYTPSRLYELAKMDGAIILSSDLKKILYANAQLIPSSSIATTETGTRHRTAERTAKQTGEIVVSISQRRNIITVFQGYSRYVLEDTSKVISKANQALQTVEKYKKVFDSKLNMLNEYEFNDIVTLENVITAIQRAEMVMKIVDEVQRSIYELGAEGRLLEMQLEELVGGLEKEELLIIKDYIAPGKKRTSEKVLKEIKRNINLDNKYFYGFFIDKYFFRYDGCGEAFHKNADYFEVITIHNTHNILTIYPSLDGKFHNNIDLNYILLEDVPTRKLSQIDKFNQRYKKK